MKTWIIVLAVGGVAIALLLGLFGRSESVAQQNLCTSVGFLKSDIASLKGLDASTASKGQYQSTINTIQSDLVAIKDDAKQVAEINKGQLQDAWSQYQTAVRAIPDTAAPGDAVSTFKQATQTLRTNLDHAVGGLDCSST